MLTKVLKYDLLFGLNRYGLLITLMAGTLLSGLAGSLFDNNLLNNLLLVINILASLLFVCAYVITSLQFVYNSLSSDQCYFSYTIPVKTVTLLFSKLLAMWIWGFAMTLVLVLGWVSLNATLLTNMGLSGDVPPEFWGLFIPLILGQAALMTCLLLFSIALFNTPKLKNLNAGVAVVAIVTYGFAQLIGLLELGTVLLWQLLIGGDLSFLTRDVMLAQDMVIMETAGTVITTMSLLISALLFLYTVRSLRLRRSI